MDFDDTWHPATHPSGAVLPAVLALAETLPVRPTGLELLLAFNVGIEIQGRLLRFSKEAHNIPKRQEHFLECKAINVNNKFNRLITNRLLLLLIL